MPATEAPCVELGSAPGSPGALPSPSPSEISTASSPTPQEIHATPLFRALALPPPDPEQPPGQDELERRLPGYRRIVIPRELTLIELLKQSSGVSTDEDVLRIREAKLRVVAERVGLRRLNVLAPRLRTLILDGSALPSLRELGIGLVHLKHLSINRCGLTCLDGVWGLSALRELHAAGNRLHDLQPLAALQKLHTLNMADNPIPDTSRLWTLGVISSLRRLTLRGTPAYNTPDYRTAVISALPMLQFLDDRSITEEYDEEYLCDEEPCSSDSEAELEMPDVTLPKSASETQSDPSSSTKTNGEVEGTVLEKNSETSSRIRRLRRRPNTTESAGVRPDRPELPRRPKTAHEKPIIDAPTRLQIMNTLMDEDWSASGSKLTSVGTVCGNLTRALRRPTSAQLRRNTSVTETEANLMNDTMKHAARAIAAEIPRALGLEEWAKFKVNTGIDIDIDFSKMPGSDPLKAIERLEEIERETAERLNEGKGESPGPSTASFTCGVTFMNEFERWKDVEFTPKHDAPRDVNSLFRNIGLFSSEEGSVVDCD